MQYGSFLAVIGLGLLMSTHSAQAAGESDRITASGLGSATAKPDVAEIRATVSANSQVAADSLKKFRDNRRRAVEALEKLKLPNLTVSGGGPSMQAGTANQQQMVMAMFGNGTNEQPNMFTISEVLTFKLKAIDGMKPEEVIERVVKLVDTAKDAGMTATVVRFSSTKADETRAVAFQVALAAARTKADAIAKASHCRIARVAASRESTVAASDAAQSMNPYIMMIAAAQSAVDQTPDMGALYSLKLDPIVVSVRLDVDFVTEVTP